MLNTQLFTRLSVVDPISRTLKVEVQTNDLGDGNQGGLHIFDQNRQYVDTGSQGLPSLAWTRKVGSDDLFTAELSLDDLLKANPNLDLGSLGATAWVDVGGYRIWEQNDHRVQAAGQDRLLPLPTQGYGHTRRTARAEAASGHVEMDFDTQGYQGNKDYTGQTGVTRIRLVPTDNRYDGLSSIEVLLMPEIALTNVRTNWTDWSAPLSNNRFEDHNADNVVTLRRQPDGSFGATAPAGEAFVVQNFGRYYEAGNRELSRLSFAFVNPLTNEWDSNQGNNYAF